MLLGIDEGTSAVKASLFDLDLRPLAEARREKPLSHPRPGWVEQDPDAVLVAVVDAVAELLRDLDGEVVACGLDHQGESVLAWDAEIGSRAVADRDLAGQALAAGARRARRPASSSRRGAACRSTPTSRRASSPGCSASARSPRRWRPAAPGSARSTPGSATCWAPASPPTFPRPRARSSRCLASRTGTRSCSTAFGVPRAALPDLVDSAGDLGELRHPDWPVALPLRARVVDQQAALAGRGLRGARARQGHLRHRRVRARARRRPVADGELRGRTRPDGRLARGRARGVRARRRRVHRRGAARVALARSRPRGRPARRWRRSRARSRTPAACACCPRWPASAPPGGGRTRAA